jgi:fatty-acyl-CoA synthase
MRLLRATTPIGRTPGRVLPLVIDALAERHGEAPALIGADEQLSYRALAQRSNRYARWALGEGVTPGDTVCLLMPNRPEYMAAWLGIIRAGGVAALLNTQLGGRALAHGINLVAPKHIIVDSRLIGAFLSARPYLAANARTWLHGEGREAPRIDRAIEASSDAPLTERERPPLTVEDRALYVYTSGTTGMPKAANVNHYRLLLAMLGFAALLRTRPSDRLYDCLPMYHTLGGVVATGAPLIGGGSVVIREKFSAQDFWNDIRRFDCTLFTYIGELCRYLLRAPAQAADGEHRLRLCCGNGLRGDIWPAFQQRFRIPRILEFYGATEGNVSLFNLEGRPGAVGRVPWFLAHYQPMAIVRFDVERDAVLRDAGGFCIPCGPDETGEAIGRIIKNPKRPASRFEGYAQPEETERKILRDVFEPGDAWFRTGDLMRRDARGFFYFVDRIGDTFRWKGENVATSEVAEAIAAFPGISEANVFGVSVAGNEGRAGMAAVVAEAPLDLAALRRHLMDRLPDYGRPLFLRLVREMEVTATFKHKKVDMARQGFDPSRVTDPLYFNDRERGAFVRIDRELYEAICREQVRL